MRPLLLINLILIACSPAMAQEWQLSRMPWGDPDMQGIWTSATITTLDRPDELENLVLTEEQARVIERYGQDALESIDNIPEGDLEAGEDGGGVPL